MRVSTNVCGEGSESKPKRRKILKLEHRHLEAMKAADTVAITDWTIFRKERTQRGYFLRAQKINLKFKEPQ